VGSVCFDVFQVDCSGAAVRSSHRGYSNNNIVLINHCIASVRRAGIVISLCALLVGCGAMLPVGLSDARIGFDSFEEAERALAQVAPYRTTLHELESLGFKARESPNVVRISYPDSIARLSPNASIPLDTMEQGIRDCITARSGCQLYEFHFGHQRSRRVGNFVLDFFNFRRRTVTSGWRFTALVAIKNDIVLFTSHGGEPQVSQVEQRTNPLGPLQSTGEMTGGLLTR
jgi:hypothetical protein